MRRTCFTAAFAIAVAFAASTAGAQTPAAQQPTASPAGSTPAAAATTAAAAAVAPATVPSGIKPPADYVIGVDDQLDIAYWQDKDMSAAVTVRPDGNISLPLLNDIKAAGLTPEELRSEIVKAAAKFVENLVIVRPQAGDRRWKVRGAARLARKLLQAGAIDTVSDPDGVDARLRLLQLLQNFFPCTDAAGPRVHPSPRPRRGVLRQWRSARANRRERRTTPFHHRRRSRQWP